MFVSLKTFQCPVCNHFYRKHFMAANGMCTNCEKEMREQKSSPQLELPL